MHRRNFGDFCAIVDIFASKDGRQNVHSLDPAGLNDEHAAPHRGNIEMDTHFITKSNAVR